MRRFEVIRFGCNSHKFDNTLGALAKAYAAVWLAHPEWVGPKLMPNKFQVHGVQQAAAGAAAAAGADAAGGGTSVEEPAAPRGHPDPCQGVRAGGLYWARLVSFLVASPDPRENGIQTDWLEYMARADDLRGFALTTALEVLGKARFHEALKSCGPLMARSKDLTEFLEYIQARKGKWGNMEQNVYDGLKDMPTQLEVALCYLFYHEIAFPSMALKKNYDDHWEMSEVYDHFLTGLQRLQHDITPLFTGMVDVQTVSIITDEEGNVTTEARLEKQPMECLLGPEVKRDRAPGIHAVRDFVSNLSAEHMEQITALAVKGIEDMLVVFTRFAQDQLTSQAGKLTKEQRAYYGVSKALKVEVTNDRYDTSLQL